MSIKKALALPPVQAVALSVAAAGGRAWLVGGAVRDALLGRSNKDIDLEVHGLDGDVLGRVLGGLGRPKAVGRSFGVFKITLAGLELDVALPRGDSQSGVRGEVSGDPHLSIEDACFRRDLSINAIAADPLTGEICDPTGGRADLVARRLRAVDDRRFGDDPARALRVARFAAVLNFAVTPELLDLCAQQDLGAVPGERLLPELEKLLASPTASNGLRVAAESGVLQAILPAIGEGWESAAAGADRAAVRAGGLEGAGRRLAVRLAVLLASTTPGEAEAGLDRLRVYSTGGYKVRDVTLACVAAQAEVHDDMGPTALRELAESVPLVELFTVAASLRPTLDLGALRASAREAGVEDGPLPALVQGRDLVKAGVPPGPALGRVLAQIRAAQVQGTVTTRQEAVALAGRLCCPEER